MGSEMCIRDRYYIKILIIDFIFMSTLSEIKQKFAVSKNAALRIQYLLKQEEKNCFFRLKVNGGGCSGFQYDFSFDKNRNEDDLIFKYYNTEILIDEMSLTFLDGSTLDFIDDLSGSFFQVNNPNASSSCGCGTSFSI